MSRSISQIYSEAVYNRNNYMQITELDSGILNSRSKMSIMNLFTYVMSVLIYTYETILDVFEVNIAKLLSQRINGTPEYYAFIAKKYQYNDATQTADELFFDEDALKVRYKELNTSHQIVTQSAWEYNVINTTNNDGVEVAVRNGIVLKVCKDSADSDSESGAIYEPLSNYEMTGFRAYINQVKFLGAKISCISTYGDILTISNCNVKYNKNYITATQAFEGIKAALISYAQNIGYNGYIYYQSIIDAIQSAEYILDIEPGTVITLTPFDSALNAYGEPVVLNGRMTAYSGYVTFLDGEGNSTINTTNITLSGISSAQE